MDIKLSQCFIAVADHDKALAFYRDVLGLEVRSDVGFEGIALGPPHLSGVPYRRAASVRSSGWGWISGLGTLSCSVSARHRPRDRRCRRSYWSSRLDHRVRSVPGCC